MKIEDWELCEFFDEPEDLGDMNYGYWAYKLLHKEIKVKIRLSLIEDSVEIQISGPNSQFIKINNIETILSSPEEISFKQKSENRIIYRKTEAGISCVMEIN